MTRQLAHALVRRYPLAWRERYEAEVCALIDDSSLRVSDVAEFVRGLLTERARELVSSAERPKRTRFVLALMRAMFWLGFCVLGPAAGGGLRYLTGPWSEQAHQVTAWVTPAFAVAFVALLVRTRNRPFSIQQPYPAWVAKTVLPCLLLAEALAMASGAPFGPMPGAGPSGFSGLFRYFAWFNWWLFFPFVQDLISSLPWPSQPLLSAFTKVSALEKNLKQSQDWVDGCRDMIAKGVPSPLGQAEAQAAELQRQLEEAREHVHSLGYRARFRQDLAGAGEARLDRA